MGSASLAVRQAATDSVRSLRRHRVRDCTVASRARAEAAEPTGTARLRVPWNLAVTIPEVPTGDTRVALDRVRSSICGNRSPGVHLTADTDARALVAAIPVQVMAAVGTRVRAPAPRMGTVEAAQATRPVAEVIPAAEVVDTPEAEGIAEAVAIANPTLRAMNGDLKKMVSG